MASSLTGATPTVTNVKGTGYQQISTPNFSQGQTAGIEQLIQGLMKGLPGGLDFLSSLAGGGNEEMWRQLEAPAMRQFGELQGQLASRFSGMGTGARRSSGFQNTSTAAAGDLAERLQSQRMGLQSQATRDLFSMGQSLLTTPLTSEHFIQKDQPFWKQLLLGATPGLTQGGSQAGLLALFSKLGLLGI